MITILLSFSFLMIMLHGIIPHHHHHADERSYDTRHEQSHHHHHDGHHSHDTKDDQTPEPKHFPLHHHVSASHDFDFVRIVNRSMPKEIDQYAGGFLNLFSQPFIPLKIEPPGKQIGLTDFKFNYIPPLFFTASRLRGPPLPA